MADLRPSVVIPARNAAPVLGACLASLANGAGGVEPREVLVVDDASTDATAVVARAYGARVLQALGRGPAAARNLGARAAAGEIVVFLDADCVPQPGCLAALLAPFADARVAGVRGRYISTQRTWVARFTQLELAEKQDRLAASREVAVLDTACAAYRRAVFLAHGGFDETFPVASAEDVDLSFRLAARGERLVYAPEARVAHRHPEDLVTYVRRKVRFGYFRARVYGRYPARMMHDGYTPRLMPLQIVLAGALVPLALASVWLPSAGPLALVVAGALGAASAPLTWRAWRTDRPLTPLVPALVFVRAVAQGSGLAAGLLALAAQRLGAGLRAGLCAGAASGVGERR